MPTQPAVRCLTRRLAEDIAAILQIGDVVALKGLGGFQLAVDAFNRDAIATLRARKQRPHQPLALMADKLATLERYCELPAGARELLTSAQAPIVIRVIATLHNRDQTERSHPTYGSGR